IAWLGMPIPGIDKRTNLKSADFFSTREPFLNGRSLFGANGASWYMGNKVLNNLDTTTTAAELYAFNELYKGDPMFLLLLIGEAGRQPIAEIQTQFFKFF